jgi:hypothetical protein
MPPLNAVATSETSSLKNTQRGQLNQQVGKLVDTASTNSASLIAALQALAAAINAKPSA